MSTVIDVDREELVAAYEALGGKGYNRRWRIETLAAKVEKLLEASPEPELEPEVDGEPIEKPVPPPLPVPPPAPTPAPRPAPAPKPQSKPQEVIEEDDEISPDTQDHDVVEHLVAHAVSRVPRAGDRAPMCVGLAFLPSSMEDNGYMLFARDNGSRWLSLSFLVKGCMREDSMQDRWWLSVRKTSFHYGVPRVGPGGILHHSELTGKPGVDRLGDTTIGGVSIRDRRLIRATNDTMWGMLSTGFTCRSSWSDFSDKFVNFVADEDGVELRVRQRYNNWLDGFKLEHGRDPKASEKRANMLLFGGQTSHNESVIHHREWMPVPMMAFSVSLRGKLFDIVTMQKMDTGDHLRTSPYAIMNRFLADVTPEGKVSITSPFSGTLEEVESGRDYGIKCLFLHVRNEHGERRILRLSRRAELTIEEGDSICAGQLIGHEYLVDELPPEWADATGAWKSRWLREAIGGALEVFMADWFDRQCVELCKGLMHCPAVLGQFAAQFSHPDKLIWDLRPCVQFYEEEYGGFVLPTINERSLGRSDFRILTPFNELMLDFTPQDDRFQSPPCRWWEMSANKAEKLQWFINEPGVEDTRSRNNASPRISRLAQEALARYRQQQREKADRDFEARVRKVQAPKERVVQRVRTKPPLRRGPWENMPMRYALVEIRGQLGIAAPVQPKLLPETKSVVPTQEELVSQLEEVTKKMEEETFDERMTRLWGPRWLAIKAKRS